MPSPDEMFMQMIATRDLGLTLASRQVSGEMAAFGRVSDRAVVALAGNFSRVFGTPVTNAGLINLSNLFNNPFARNRITGVQGDVNRDGWNGMLDLRYALDRGALNLTLFN